MTLDARTAVVLSSGAANGAYEVGVLKALASGASPATGHRPIDPGIYTGSSTGAYNATVMACESGAAADAIAYLESVWLDRIAGSIRSCGNGVFRVRGVTELIHPACWTQPVRALTRLGADAVFLGTWGALKSAQFLASDASLQSRVLSLVDIGALVSESPLEGLLEDTVDLARLRRSRKQLTVATTDWQAGILRLFSGREIAYEAGTDAVLASTALPGIFPPVLIDGVPYNDGSTLMTTPIRPAIRLGASSLHVVFLDPLLESVPFQPLASTLEVFYRLFAILSASQIRNDIARAEAINRTLELVGRNVDVEALRRATSRSQARQLLEAGNKVLERLPAQPYRQLLIHVYRPTTALGSGEEMLDFSCERIRRLIDLGYEDAEHHDCAAAGCVLIGGGE